MQKTKERITNQKLAVTLDGLAAMLSCGLSTAKKIGEDAEARVIVGKRVLYCVKTVEKYLEAISE